MADLGRHLNLQHCPVLVRYEPSDILLLYLHWPFHTRCSGLGSSNIIELLFTDKHRIWSIFACSVLHGSHVPSGYPPYVERLDCPI